MKNKYHYLIILFLIVASVAAFGRIAGNDFINFDDNLYITENNNVQSGLNPENFKWALTTVISCNWHPLTMLSHTADWSLFGAKASGHHLVSLFLHIGAVVFLFLFLFKATNNLWPAAFAAAAFALHPLRVESVAWASERKDVLSMFFGMATLWAYSFYVENFKPSKYILCLILFTLALMSKPMMVTLPFAMMLLDYWPLGRWQKVITAPPEKRFELGGKLVREKIPFILLTVVACWIAFWAQSEAGAVAPFERLPLGQRLSNALVAYDAYLGKTLWPSDLAIFYPYNLSLPLWKVAFSGMILIIITVTVLYYIRKFPFLFVGWFWYLGTLVPVSGLVQVGLQSMADRYSYLPSVGIAIGLAWGIPLLFRSKEMSRKILFPAAMVFVAILSVMTSRQCGYWQNSISLFEHAARVTKNNFVAYSNIGLALANEGKDNAAIHLFSKAIGFNSSQALIYYSRGTSLGKTGQYQLALNDFDKAISLNREYLKAYNNRGVVYTQMGLPAKAISDFNEAIRLDPDYADAWNNRAYAYLNQGDKISGCRDAGKACDLGNCRALKWAEEKRLCN